MKFRTMVTFCVLLIVLNMLFLTSNSLADEREFDETTKAIKQKNSLWSAKETSLSKLAAEERKKRLGAQLPILSPDAKTLDASSSSLPVELDWRNYNSADYVTPVKEQGACGACWAFATTAALESKVLISQNTPGVPLDLSEQLLTSCSGSGTCAAGSIGAASDFLSNFGLPPESFYPYTASDGICITAVSDWEASAYKIPGWSLIKPTVSSIKSALYNYGPLVALMAVQTDFYYYYSGIYTYTGGSFEGYHAALIVGYNDLEQYFIVKSSWGAEWGENGYFRIAYSEIKTSTKFGHWTIAYNGAIPSDFPIIDGVARDANNSDAGNNGTDASGNDAKDKESHGKGSDVTAGGSEGNKQDKGKNGAEGTSTLAGTVSDEAGNAVRDATIKADKFTTATDKDGKYQLPSLPAGDYVVTATKEGYSKAAVDLSVLPNDTVTKDFIINKNRLNEPSDQAGKKKKKGPGWIMGKAEAVSPEDAAAYYVARKKEMIERGARNMPLAASAADYSTDEIRELARGLRYDPKLIYDYVLNNIEYEPYYGSLKGATLTYLEGSGNDFDQASLMIALLRESGYTANYVYGKMTIDADSLARWIGSSFWDEGVLYYWPEIALNVITDGGNPRSPLLDGDKIYRVWVKATIPGSACGTNCLFDPAFKKHILLDKINIGTVMGYNQGTFLTEAGGTVGNGGYSIRGLVKQISEPTLLHMQQIWLMPSVASTPTMMCSKSSVVKRSLKLI